MDLALYAATLFFVTYTINLIYISIFYHRALAHSSVVLPDKLQKFILSSGPWIVGLDPVAWSCMHRLHHLHSDTKFDPHSPHYLGKFGLLFGQLISYKRILVALIKRKSDYTDLVKDIDCSVHWLYRSRIWWLPYVLHLAIGITIAAISGSALLGNAYFFGIMSHPIQGWLINAFAHSIGYQNFDNQDKSVNNLLLAYLVFGEGYQNNHHHAPNSANFGVRWFEIDFGYWLCVLLQQLNLLKIVKHSDEIFHKEGKSKIIRRSGGT